MKRKDYQKPTTKVVEMQMQTQTMLTTSTQLNVTYTEEDWQE